MAATMTDKATTLEEHDHQMTDTANAEHARAEK